MSGGAASLVQRGGVSVRRAIGRALAGISPGLRRWLLIVAATCLVLAAAYQLWLRDSSLVAVEHVTVTGLTTSDAKRLRMALRNAGGTMTTLHVDRDALERAAAAYPVARELEVTTDFPHGLRIHVIEHHPAAIAVSGAGRVPVAGDGTILRGLPVEGRLPIIHVDGALGDRLEDGDGRAAAAVAGAAPPILRTRIVDVRRRSDDGLVANLRKGPELIFGSATRLRAKWEAAIRVLADLEARGTSYLDLRIPDRPAAGGLRAETVAPVAPAGTATTAPGAPAAPSAQSAATDPAAAPAPPDQAASPSPPADGAPTPSTPAPAAPDTAQPQPGTTITGGPAGGAIALPQP